MQPQNPQIKKKKNGVENDFPFWEGDFSVAPSSQSQALYSPVYKATDFTITKSVKWKMLDSQTIAPHVSYKVYELVSSN